MRVLTLTGAGGIGKTRLALAVAERLVDAYPNGVSFVALAPIGDPALVIPTIAQTLGVRETSEPSLAESLHYVLRQRHMLLVLDNFEQILSAAPDVADLLASAPQLTVLVTSRARLHLSGEHEFPVPPLTLPDPEQLPDLEALSHYAAVALFIRQAQAVKPDFEVTHANAAAVAEICARLDGLPLAIELAAARSKLFAPHALLARLGKRLQVLTGGARDLPARQQTIRATITWSYDLLQPAEQRLFMRLAVFVGGWTVEGAEAVCTVAGDLDIDVLEGLQALLDQSLLRPPVGQDGEPRFHRYETIREYARERLQASGELEALARKHATYYLGLTEAAEPKLTSGKRDTWLPRLDAEHDNLRAALAWTLEHAPELALRLAGSLAWFWYFGGHLREGRAWLERALARAAMDSSPRARDAAARRARAKALAGAGMLAIRQTDSAAARALLEESVALLRELGDRPGLAAALTFLGEAVMSQGDASAGRTLEGESANLFRQLGDDWGLALALTALGQTASYQDENAAVRAWCGESATLFRRLGDDWGLAQALSHLGRAALNERDYAQAEALYEESMALTGAAGDRLLVVWLLIYLGYIAQCRGDHTRAGELFEESVALHRELGYEGGLVIAFNLGPDAHKQGDYGRLPSLLEESLALARAGGDTWAMAHVLGDLGTIARTRGDFRRALALMEESVAYFRALSDMRGVAGTLYDLGWLSLELGDVGGAGRAFMESLEIWRENDERSSYPDGLDTLACVAGARGAAARTARLCGAADAERTNVVVPALRPSYRAVYDRIIAAARAELGEAGWQTAWGEGCAMTLEQAIAYALEEVPDG